MSSLNDMGIIAFTTRLKIDITEKSADCVIYLLNNKTRIKQTSIWHNLIQWWNVPFPATRPEWHLVLDDDDVAGTGVKGFAIKLYNYVFGS